jgi:hypothetical protein
MSAGDWGSTPKAAETNPDLRGARFRATRRKKPRRRRRARPTPPPGAKPAARGAGSGLGLPRICFTLRGVSMDPAFSKISQVRLSGGSGGAVKTLRGFDKSRHSVPDAVNAATSGFLAKLCSAELAEEAEAMFQRARTALGYKRTGISLDLSPALATLTTKDFCWELAYALEPSEPARYSVTRILHSLRSGELVRLDAFNELFAGQFDAVVFDLARGVRVEAVVDAVEALDAEAEDALHVDYPSDCSRCVIQAPGVSARVECDGATLAMRFPRAGSPAECLREFAALREAFRLSKDATLAGLLG